MDPETLLRPVGPLPERVYWVRRTVVAAAAVVLLLLTIRLLAWTSPGSGPSATGPAGAAPRSSTPSSSPSPLPLPSSAAPATPPAVPECPDGALVVTAATDAQIYPAGRLPVLTITVRNIGMTPCRRDLGPGSRALTVRSGVDRVWSSADCGKKGSDRLVLARGAARSYDVRWSRLRSRPGCPSGRTPALPGTYRLYARLSAITSAQAVFFLR